MAPKLGEEWHVCEGIKDAAALVGLGCQAIGMPGSSLARKFVRWFKGVDVVLWADRDVPGENGAIKSAARLTRVARSVCIVHLPSELRLSQGEDVRDILAREGGEEQLRRRWPMPTNMIRPLIGRLPPRRDSTSSNRNGIPMTIGRTSK